MSKLYDDDPLDTTNYTPSDDDRQDEQQDGEDALD
jgi:hypothetical protein